MQTYEVFEITTRGKQMAGVKGKTTPAYSVLQLLAKRKRVSIETIAAHLGQTQKQAGMTVALLAYHGMVRNVRG